MLCPNEEPASAGVSASGSSSHIDPDKVGNAYNSYSDVSQVPVDLVFDLATWVEASAPKPMNDAALVTAFAIVGAIVQRSYNVKGLGLNLYWLLLSATGTGKGVIPRCFGKAIDEVAKTVPAANELKGPSLLASGPGLSTALAERTYPFCLSCFDEWGHDLAEIADKRNPVGKGKEKLLLLLYSLSGEGSALDPKAHSDSAKNTPPLVSPAYSFVGTTTPEKFNRVANDDAISSGFLPRILIVENGADIPPDNDNHLTAFNAFPAHIVERLRDLASMAFVLAQQRRVQHVTLAPEADMLFHNYGEQLRLRLNASAEGPARQLWNRAREKALKLAAIIAVGRNHVAPCISGAEARWAVDFAERHTGVQVAKFSTGDIGEIEGNQQKQVEQMRRVIAEYLSAPLGKYNKANCSFKMHACNVFTHKYLNDRLFSLPAFKGDKAGATAAIKRTIETLLSNSEIGRMGIPDLAKEFEYHGHAYTIRGLDVRPPAQGGS